MSDGPVSMVLETNVGGVPVTICSCGVLLLTAMWSKHAERCPIYLWEKLTDE